MADPPRAPLVVIPEASWFPTAFAAPWVRRDALGAESSVTSSDVQDLGVLHSQTCPVLPLPRPVVVLNTDDTTCLFYPSEASAEDIWVVVLLRRVH